MVGSIQCRSSRHRDRGRLRARSRTSRRIRRLISPVSQRIQHRDPGRQDELGAPLQPARRRLDARALMRLRALSALSSICSRRRCASRISGSASRFSPRRDRSRAPRAIRSPSGCGSGFQRIEGVARRRCGRAHGRRPPRENLRPARAGLRRDAPSSLRRPARRPPRPLLPAPLRGFVVGDQILQPLFQPAHAAARAAFGPADPAAQFRHLASADEARRSRYPPHRTGDGLRRRHSARAARPACRWSRRRPASPARACAITSA